MPCGACPTEVSRAVTKCIQQATLDDHSEVVPPLPIPNRTVKHLSADDSGRTSVKVGHRQALTLKTPQALPEGFCLCTIESLFFFLRFVYFLDQRTCFIEW